MFTRKVNGLLALSFVMGFVVAILLQSVVVPNITKLVSNTPVNSYKIHENPRNIQQFIENEPFTWRFFTKLPESNHWGDEWFVSTKDLVSRVLIEFHEHNPMDCNPITTKIFRSTESSFSTIYSDHVGQVCQITFKLDDGTKGRLF